MPWLYALLLLAVPVSHSAELPKWQQVRLVGKVDPKATSDGLTLAPASGFGCVLKDETKPVESQDAPHDCSEIVTKVFLSDGTSLYPPVETAGSVAGGLQTTWDDWATSLAGWGSKIEDLKPSSDGTVTAKLFSLPLEGGCVPTKVVNEPVRDRKGQRCLASHGETTLPLGPAALLALDRKVQSLESGDDTACVPNLKGCDSLTQLESLATCSACQDEWCDEAACESVHERAVAAVQGQVSKAAWAAVRGAQHSSTEEALVDLVGLLSVEDERLASEDRAALKSALGKTLAEAFNRRLASGDTAAAGGALRHLEGLQGSTTANTARRERLTAKLAEGTTERAESVKDSRCNVYSYGRQSACSMLVRGDYVCAPAPFTMFDLQGALVNLKKSALCEVSKGKPCTCGDRDPL